MNASKRQYLWFLMVLVASLGLAGVCVAGDLEPSGPPGPTMRTLEELLPAWSQKITDASKRFQLVLDDQAVLDKETGLVWERAPDAASYDWGLAGALAQTKNVGGRKGWRVPTLEELLSLVDTSVSGSPKLPSGHPFVNVHFEQEIGLRPSDAYWTVTTLSGNNDAASVVYFHNGTAGAQFKNQSSFVYVWCVRGGHNPYAH